MYWNLKRMVCEKFGSQWKFAMKVELHEGVVSRIIQGRCRLRVEDVALWAKVLGCPEADLVYLTKPIPKRRKPGWPKKDIQGGAMEPQQQDAGATGTH